MIHAFFQVVATAGMIAAGGDPPPPSQPIGDGSTSIARYTGSLRNVEVTTPFVTAADIDVDGRIVELHWEQAALLDGFTQFNPVEGSEASQKTEVLVLVDNDALYFAVRAYDDAPGEIRATLSERDSYGFSDDYIRFILDTYDDQRRAYVFTVNPLGVQHDGLWNESGGGTGRRGRGMFSPIDDSPDFLWSSEAHITDWGYEAEIRIPFKSLRFPDVEDQSWGLQIERKIQRNGFESSWAPITANVANRLTQAGKLNALRNLDMGLSLEINPVATGAWNGEIDEFGQFGHLDPTGEFGINAAYGITSNLKLDATINPDFSQVEADAGQVQVNERFSLFFPEQRPFFLEGTEIFGMPKQLVYTRTIANPIAGGKLTGKVGSLNVGYLGAIDEGFDADANTYVNLVRLRQDVGASSTLGAVYTDRTVDANDFNRVAGADARIQLAGRYTFTLMGAQSFTNNALLAGRTEGRMGAFRFERAGRAFSINAELEDSQAGFDAGSGFFQRIGDTQFNSRAAYNWFGTRGSFLESVNPSLEVKGYWDHDAFWDGQGLEESEIQLSNRVSFKNNITVWANVQRTMFEYRPEQYATLFVEQPDGSFSPFLPDQSLFNGLTGMSVGLWFNNWERVRGNVRLSFNDTPIFDRRVGVAVEPAKSRSGEVRLNLYPIRPLRAEVSVNFSRLERARDGAEHSTAVIPRIRAQYQFSRALFLRTIFEYGHQESAALMDPVTGRPLYLCQDSDCSARAGSVSNDFRIEGLVGYEPSPGTVFYLGYTREMEDASAFGFENVRPTRDGLFMKLSYLFRM
ncbi:MAG: carbohydrate binding family 9 domain-containing protein [Gemmatimonadota bacterium]|nr:carbohydrate binding family 9 domain-containing protein [Gemmatimonadota bacterium]